MKRITLLALCLVLLLPCGGCTSRQWGQFVGGVIFHHDDHDRHHHHCDD